MRCIHHPCAKPGLVVAHRRECKRMLEGQCQCADDLRRLCLSHGHFSLRPSALALAVRRAHQQHLTWIGAG